MKIGIYGGTFNPIHRGHIALARQIFRKKRYFEPEHNSRMNPPQKKSLKNRLDQIWFMVSPQNPFKQQDELLDENLRLEIVRKALTDDPNFIASDYEFHLPRPSYTWDTLQALSKDYPEHEFLLIIGSDNWLQFDRWHRADDILRNYRIIIYPREGYDVDPATLPPTVTLVQTQTFGFSSTDVRRKISEGLTFRRMVPATAYDDILAHYGNSNR